MKEDGPCVRCGELTDVRLGEVWICTACYEVRSSCCPEFGPDDLATHYFAKMGETVSPLPNPQAALRALADPRRAAGQQRFFKTGPGEYAEGDVFLGVPVPVVRKLVRTYENLAHAAMLELLRTDIHEQRLLALLIMVRRYPRGDERERAALYRLYTHNFRWINNWDLIDVTAEHVAGAHLFGRNRAPLYRWAAARSIWPRRIAIMATFHFVKRGDYADTLRLAELFVNDPHDLIHKATGWMLREIGNRDRAVEEAFLDRHAARMPRTMLRYATEKFSEGARWRYLTARDV